MNIDTSARLLEILEFTRLAPYISVCAFGLLLVSNMARFFIGTIRLGPSFGHVMFQIAFSVISILALISMGFFLIQSRAAPSLQGLFRGKSRVVLCGFLLVGILELAGLRYIATSEILGVDFYDDVLLLMIISVAIVLFFNDRLSRRRRIVLFVLVCSLVVSDYVIGYVAYSVAETNITHATGDRQKVLIASKFSDLTVYQDSALGYTSDRLAYYAFGFGACEGKSTLEQSLLQKAGFQTRLIDLPGEDHMFLEVMVNGTWYVSDPGYSNLWFDTPAERGEYRVVNESLGFSLAYVYGSNPIQFVTSDFTNTDTIIIHATKNGLPLANGSLVLRHIFMGHEFYVPQILLNSNGTAVLQIGTMEYGKEAGDSQPFYQVSINGIMANQTITSYGNGTVSYVQVNLP